ncbi:inositol monophosphatase [Acidaminobacter sp. JC074]|uniref:inositol monophosphatase family protein n=1 Tax=Acidaminobacter sp. JC074 TaxID=2530199 RepID=UPI001F0ED603|nr:inositol monophosphatase [Acidaminobacter sp. JC074]MCH4886465.1 inositol monophosphatase [Acidaminobacter sp. JC074]
MENTLKILTELMKEVGAYQVDKFKSRAFTYETKSTEIDIVTEVDQQSEKMLIEGLKKHFPDYGFLAEESGEQTSQTEYRWVIDPLDGTTNFSTGIPIFAISVGLEKHDEVVLGAVYVPILKDMYTALKGHGAHKNGKALSVNDSKNLRTSVIATGFPYDRAENPVNNVKEISIMAPKVKGIRRIGVAAYDLCLVAEGVFSGYWEYGLKPWDYAAGLLLALEAGAKYQPLTKRENSMIVCNEHILEEMKSHLL